MIIKCKQCGKNIDESKFWTVCPHNPINEAPDAVFCRVHSEFDCVTCDDHLVRR